MNVLGLVVSLQGLLLFQAGKAQTACACASVAIDPSRPYIDIVFDRYGKRSPAFEGESEVGLWLRIRNNSCVPIEVDSRRDSRAPEGRNDNPARLLVHDIVEGARFPGDTVVQPRPVIKKPYGYPYMELVTDQQDIGPGGELLFSVPLRHVTRLWSIAVQVRLLGPAVGRGEQPRTFVDFGWWGLSAEAQKASDAELFGSAQPAKK
jgi:hypothetical protein